MTKLFYDHLIVFEEVIAVLDDHKFSQKDKENLIKTIDELFHQHILDEILTHLPKDHHKEFLKQFLESPNNRNILHFLKEHSEIDIEKAIFKRANKVKRKVITYIHRVSKKNV